MDDASFLQAVTSLTSESVPYFNQFQSAEKRQSEPSQLPPNREVQSAVEANFQVMDDQAPLTAPADIETTTEPEVYTHQV